MNSVAYQKNPCVIIWSWDSRFPDVTGTMWEIPLLYLMGTWHVALALAPEDDINNDTV